jgi:hypothetical protein
VLLHELGQAEEAEAWYRKAADVVDAGAMNGLGVLLRELSRIRRSHPPAAAMAADLIAWLQILGLDGELAAAEPKRLRYRILHTAARLIRGQRRRWLRIPSTWPWADQITAAFRGVGWARHLLVRASTSRSLLKSGAGSRRVPMSPANCRLPLLSRTKRVSREWWNFGDDPF